MRQLRGILASCFDAVWVNVFFFPGVGTSIIAANLSCDFIYLSIDKYSRCMYCTCTYRYSTFVRLVSIVSRLVIGSALSRSPPSPLLIPRTLHVDTPRYFPFSPTVSKLQYNPLSSCEAMLETFSRAPPLSSRPPSARLGRQ
jgi:hypothetical protein